MDAQCAGRFMHLLFICIKVRFACIEPHNIFTALKTKVTFFFWGGGGGSALIIDCRFHASFRAKVKGLGSNFYPMNKQF